MVGNALQHHLQVSLVHREHVSSLLRVMEVHDVPGMSDETGHFCAHYYIGQHINQVVSVHFTLSVQVENMLDDSDGSSQLVQLGLGSLELLNLLDLVNHTAPRRVLELLLGEAKVARASLLYHLDLPFKVLFLSTKLFIYVQVELQDVAVHVEHDVLTDLLNVLVHSVAQLGVVA